MEWICSDYRITESIVSERIFYCILCVRDWKNMDKTKLVIINSKHHTINSIGSAYKKNEKREKKMTKRFEKKKKKQKKKGKIDTKHCNI